MPADTPRHRRLALGDLAQRRLERLLELRVAAARRVLGRVVDVDVRVGAVVLDLPADVLEPERELRLGGLAAVGDGQRHGEPGNEVEDAGRLLVGVLEELGRRAVSQDEELLAIPFHVRLAAAAQRCRGERALDPGARVELVEVQPVALLLQDGVPTAVVVPELGLRLLAGVLVGPGNGPTGGPGRRREAVKALESALALIPAPKPGEPVSRNRAGVLEKLSEYRKGL